ncbi:MAG: glycosyltransferase [Phycisphaeraceae bacterium]|nr:glycosyltransferase [Phycisphaeraceae bacterium]
MSTPPEAALGILILADDRADELAEAVRHAQRLGRVFVLDTADHAPSRDAATSLGAVVLPDETRGHWAKRNQAVAALPDDLTWVLVLAPDERITPRLADELRCLHDNGVAGYQVRTTTLFMGRRMRTAGFGPRASLRLVKRNVLAFDEESARPTLRVDGAGAVLRGSILRLQREPIRAQIARATRQAADEAESHALRLARGRAPRMPVGRRFGATRHFLRRFILQGGFLQGRAGFHLSMLEANSRYMARVLIDEKIGRIEHEPGTSRSAPAHSGVRVSGSNTGKKLFPISCLILTRDEEVNIADCLGCLEFSDDIIVFDSLSTDRTLDIARNAPNVTVVQRAFDNWSSHQNWGVQNIRFKHPWVLYVDADERVDDNLAEELQSLADPDAPYAAVRMRRKDMFMGRWIKHATLYPTWLVRMFRPEKIRYERLVNPVAIVDGDTARAEGHLIHYPFSKGTVQWFERHNSYSSFEAQEMLKVLAGDRRKIRGLFSTDPNERRAVAKDMFYRLPLRPQVKWLYYMFWKQAWLDGWPGITYARMQYLYEYMISIKARELKRMRDGGIV